MFPRTSSNFQGVSITGSEEVGQRVRQRRALDEEEKKLTTKKWHEAAAVNKLQGRHVRYCRLLIWIIDHTSVKIASLSDARQTLRLSVRNG